MLLHQLSERCPSPGAVKKYDDLGISSLRVWCNPRPGRRYCAGADVAEGVPGGNKSVVVVLDVETLEPMAVLRGLWKPEEFARRAAALCEYFNGAMLAVERNNHGHSALNTLVNTINYPNLYFHLEYDVINRKQTQTLGFPTSPKTRPVMLDRLRDAIEGGDMPAVDPVLLSECMNFVRPDDEPDGKYEAADGCEDDEVMAYAVALQCRERFFDEGDNDVPANYDALDAAARAQSSAHFPKSGSLF
jgi:hypothetical protein